jgi:hypothetical protein
MSQSEEWLNQTFQNSIPALNLKHREQLIILSCFLHAFLMFASGFLSAFFQLPFRSLSGWNEKNSPLPMLSWSYHGASKKEGRRKNEELGV